MQTQTRMVTMKHYQPLHAPAGRQLYPQAVRPKQDPAQAHVYKYKLQKSRVYDSAPQPEVQVLKAMVLEHQQKQALKQYRPALQVRRATHEVEDLGARVPQPLPSLWRGEYELSPHGHELGGGAFAEVFRVQHRRTSRNFAVKVMHRLNFALRGIECQIGAEIGAMQTAARRSQELKDDLHILRLLDFTEEGDYVYLLLELCEQGDLLRKVAMEPNQRLPEREVAIIARQLLIGLHRVHELGYIHRDIKPDNLLMNADGKLRIADFGWCCWRQDHPKCLAGTLLYMAPEVLRNEPQDVDADVWSMGMTLYQLLVGRTLLQVYLGPGATRCSERDPHRSTEMKQQLLLKEIDRVCPPAVETKPQELSDLCWDFVRRTLMVRRAHRIPILMALEHPWMKWAAELERTLEQEKEEAKKALKEEESMPLSPKAAAKAARSPEARSPEVARSPAKEVSVPTPQKPRSFDPGRNNAFTPPVSPEPELTCSQQENIPEFHKENSADPEVSPGRKAWLLEKSGKWNSPKDDLTAEKSMEKSEIHVKALCKHKSPKPWRYSISTQMPSKLEFERGEASPSELRRWQIEDVSDHFHLHGDTLADLPEEGIGGSSDTSSVQMPVFTDLGPSLAREVDFLGTSVVHRSKHGIVPRFPGDNTRIALRAPGAEKAELLTPRTAGRASQVAPLPGAGMVSKAKVVQSAKLVHQRYLQGSPVRTRQAGPLLLKAAQPAVGPHGAVWACPDNKQVHSRMAAFYGHHVRPHVIVARGPEGLKPQSYVVRR